MKIQLNEDMIEYFASGYASEGNGSLQSLLDGNVESASEAIQLYLDALKRERSLGLKHDPSDYFLQHVEAAEQVSAWIKELGEEGAIQKCLASSEGNIRTIGESLEAQDYGALAF